MPDIPRYKRDKYIFISNLKKITADPDRSITLNRNGYLLSEKYSSRSKIKLARWVKSKRNLLISDNGNFTRMKAIAKDFEAKGRGLLKMALKELENQGHVAQNTLTARKALFNEIAKACQDSLQQQDLKQLIARQLEIDPDYIIGLEDFTIPVLMMCGLMHTVFKPAENKIKVFQQKTNQLYQDQVDGKFGEKLNLGKTVKFVLVHAYDYASALQGGAKQLDNFSPQGVAISYGAPMRSKRWITSLQFGDQTEVFSEKLPEPYLISTAITMGLVNGLNSDMPIHVLGVGSPILIALIGQLLHRSRAVSIDSTSPFKDSNAGTIYGSRYAFLKMDMLKVLAHSLINNENYTSTTPYFKNFDSKFPSNWAAMRSALGVTSATEVKALASQLKAAPDLIERHVPFFTHMRSGNDNLITQLRVDRAGHNYWILHRICESVRQRMNNKTAMDKWIKYQVKRYQSVASYKWSKAVGAVYLISNKYRH